MKFQKTLLAASLAIVAANAAFASGENPVKDPAHHVISGSENTIAHYSKVYFLANGDIYQNGGRYVFNENELTRNASGVITHIAGNAIAANAINEANTKDALDYLYRELKKNPAAADVVKRQELQDIYAELNGGRGDLWALNVANPELDLFTAAGVFNAQRFITLEVPEMDIYSDSWHSGVNNTLPAATSGNDYRSHNIVREVYDNPVAPVYGRDNIRSLQDLFGTGPGSQGIDLNSRKAIVDSASGQKLQLVKYGSDVNGYYQFYEMDGSGDYNVNKPTLNADGTPAWYQKDAGGNLFKVAAPGASVADLTVIRGGQYVVSTTGSGEEIKLITDEHLTYGFKSVQTATGQGYLTEDATNSRELVNQNVAGITGTDVGADKYDYVNVGVVGNTLNENDADLRKRANESLEDYNVRLRAAHYANPDKSIYGVSAERTDTTNNTRNITTLTGFGLSLSNLGTDPNATLNFDGSVTRLDGSAQIGARTVAQLYNASTAGTSTDIVKVLGQGVDGAPTYYQAVGTKLTPIVDAATIESIEAGIAGKDADYTGTASKQVGAAPVTEHNVVTNKMTQYYKEVAAAGDSSVAVSVVNNKGQVRPFDDVAAGSTNLTVDYAQLGIINGTHGVRVYSGPKVESAANPGKFANLTAEGLVTNGTVNAKVFKVDGKDVTEFLKTGVAPTPTDPTDPTDPTNPGTGTGGVTETQVNTKVEAAKTEAVTTAVTEAKAYTDTKVEGAIKTASADVTATATKAATDAAVAKVDALNKATLASAQSYTDAAVNKVSKRLDDVEKTANAGVAIALAAQQAVPNVQPGQVAVFGGVGHYEGETAVSLGAVTSFTDRISGSGAVGVADGSFGARVGISYLFGGK